MIQKKNPHHYIIFSVICTELSYHKCCILTEIVKPVRRKHKGHAHTLMAPQ